MAIEINLIRTTSTDPMFFVNRAEDVAELRLMLRGLLKNNDPDEATGVLVKGDSGVGKSIFSRSIVRDLKTELSNRMVVLEVDGGSLNGVRGLLNRLCDVAQAEISRLNNPELLRQARVLAEIADYGKITASQIKQVTSGATVGGEVGTTLWGLLTSKVTGSVTGSEANSRTDGYEIPVTDEYLSKLLNALLQQIYKADYYVLIFLDNLDRIGRTDSKEEADAIAAFIKELMTFSSSVLLLNLRTQFAHHTTSRRGLEAVALDGLSKEALLDILKKRQAEAGLTEEDRQKLDEVGFQQLAETLAELTGNPLAFLRWLHFWLTRTTNQQENLARDFRKYIRNNFTGVALQWLRFVVDELKQAEANGYEYAPLKTLEPEQLLQLERAGAIVPDDLMVDPPKRRYQLIHDLDFLLDPQDRFAETLK